MGSTYFSLHFHVVFSTKHRRPLLRDEGLKRRHSYLRGIIRGMNGMAEIVGGVADHVHMLLSLRPVHCVADVMRDLKKESTNWAKAELDRNIFLAGRVRGFHQPNSNLGGAEIPSPTRKPIMRSVHSLMS